VGKLNNLLLLINIS